MRQFDIICGGVSLPKSRSSDIETLELDVQGPKKNVELKIDAISKAVMGNISDEVMDLLEIGAYVYCADQHIRRGSEKLTNYGQDWRRDLRFKIPVRKPDLWNSEEVKHYLSDTLGFLSGEVFSFEFVRAENPINQESLYFEFSDDPLAPDDVCLFSGGIDSFAGAVEYAIGQKKKLALVGHHSANKVKSVQTSLMEGLRTKGLADQLHFISIEVRNTNYEAKEYTQRTRSFLFACLAMAIADLYGKDEFTFFENGVVSLNIPISEDVLESRATRTTHPKVISGFKRLFTEVFGKAVKVHHPYQWLTKKEVTQKIAEYDCSDLLEVTNSCTRPREQTKEKTHCGLCSQCIDRRFAVLSSGLERFESDDRYKFPLLLAPRNGHKEVNLAAQYLKFSRDFQDLRGAFDLLNKYPAMSDALSEFEALSTTEAEEKIFDLYKRHAADVLSVMASALDRYKQEIVGDRLHSTSLLSLYFNRSEVLSLSANDTGEQLTNFMDNLNEPVCEFAIDEAKSVIAFSGGKGLSGKNYELVMKLIPNFKIAKNTGVEAGYINAPTLAASLKITEQSLRQQISRMKSDLQDISVDTGCLLDGDGFIENLQGIGYRLNPSLKLVMLGDLRSEIT